MISKLGLENFTFRRLASEIGSGEASIYRYFENKHQLLLYLVYWYWEWVHFLVNKATGDQPNPQQELKSAIGVLVRPFDKSFGVNYVDQQQLHQLVINEGTKAYRTKLVDEKNLQGLFKGYKDLAENISLLLKQINPCFKHPRALASSIFEMAHNHLFFAEHLPRLTDLKEGSNISDDLEEMLWLWVKCLLKTSGGPSRIEEGITPRTVFVTRELREDSPLRQWAMKSGNLIAGHSFLRFSEVRFNAPENAQWWFFYSPKAVKFSLLSGAPPTGVCLAALGEGTARALREKLGRVDFVGVGAPRKVAEQFRSIAKGQRVFFPHAKHSRLTIQRLLANDLIVEDAVCYDNQTVCPKKRIKTDLFVFTSPLNVAAYLDKYSLPEKTRILAIGGSTAEALYQRGYLATYPKVPTEEAMVELLEEMTNSYSF